MSCLKKLFDLFHLFEKLGNKHNLFQIHLELKFCRLFSTFLFGWSWIVIFYEVHGNITEGISSHSAEYEPCVSSRWGFKETGHYTPAQRIWKGGILESGCPSVRLSVCGHNPVTALPGAILLRSRPNLIGTYLGSRSRTSSFMGDVAH